MNKKTGALYKHPVQMDIYVESESTSLFYAHETESKILGD